MHNKTNSFNICYKIYFKKSQLNGIVPVLFPLINLRIKKALNFQYSGQAGCLGREISLFTTASRLALRPTQPPIQWVPGALSPGVKQSEHEADLSTPSSAEVNECSYTTTLPYAFTACTGIIHLYVTFTLDFVQHISKVL